MGQPLLIAATVSAQLVQNRECPHSTRATSVRVAMRHTWQVSADCVLLTTLYFHRVASVAAAAGGAWSSSSASLASNTTSNAAVCAPTLWLMMTTNCRMAYDPLSHSTQLYTSIVWDAAFLFRTAYFDAISNTTHICHTVDHCILQM